MKKYILKLGFHGHMCFTHGHIDFNNTLACKEKRGKVTGSQESPQTRMIARFFSCDQLSQVVTEITGKGAQDMSEEQIRVSALECAAMNNEPMPDGLSLPDQMYFQGLAWLYARYHAKQISRERGQQEKQKLIISRDRLARESESIIRFSKYYADAYTALAQASSAYAKERTLEHADAMYEALYRISPPKKDEYD